MGSVHFVATMFAMMSPPANSDGVIVSISPLAEVLAESTSFRQLGVDKVQFRDLNSWDWRLNHCAEPTHMCGGTPPPVDGPKVGPLPAPPSVLPPIDPGKVLRRSKVW